MEVIPIRSDTQGLALMVAAFVGGLALFVAGFVIAMEVQSVVATSTEAPLAAALNPGHDWDSIGLPGDNE